MFSLIPFIGELSVFGLRVAVAVRPAGGGAQDESLPLVVAAGLALATVMTMHTRNTLVTFGPGALIPRCSRWLFL